MRRRPRARRRRPRRLALLVALLAMMVAAGCAPKRVVRRDDARPPRSVGSPSAAAGVAPRAAPPPAERRPADLDLPEPEPRGPAGAGVPERTPASLTFGAQAAALAGEELGKPYQWGASGPDRFDCSGLVQHVFGQLDVQMPRVSAEQARVGREVRPSELQAGDLVFFATGRRGIDHVGIYVGGNEFIHAPNRGTPVRSDSLAHGWWRTRYRTARRVR